jgi:Cu/Ag efflux pump CusA
MAITVIVGLTSSTVLTLVVVPTIYTAIERLRARSVAAPEGVSAPAA